MKKYLFIATALAALASCSSDEFVGDQGLKEANENGRAIGFNLNTPAVTRAIGSEAAGLLNYNFVVFGYKTVGSAQTVFDNYQVNYVNTSGSSAGSTESNTAGWEYVSYKNLPFGTTTTSGGTLNNNGVAANATSSTTNVDQSIKYWDYSATAYDFFAYSLGAGEADNDDEGDDPQYAKASALSNSTYTLEGNQAQLATCYISKKKTVTPNASSATEVDLEFVSFLSKVQLKFYENIPGYSIKNLKFYSAASGGSSALTPYLIGTIPTGGTYTITFDSNGDPELSLGNGATTDTKVTFAYPTTFAGPDYKEAAISGDDKGYLGRTSNTATETDIVSVLPNSTGGTMTLRVDYTLVSRDGTGETIQVTGATATVPASYTAWKPNYVYTYIFKISDNSDGQTNPNIDKTGLYPITLDAIVTATEDGSQTTITTVATPSITTYAQETLIDNEYKAGNIYVVVNDGTVTLVTSGSGINAKLYTATLTGSTPAQSITEETVANALTKDVDGNGNYVLTDALGGVLTVSPTAENTLTAVTSIPANEAPGGKAMDIKGAKFTATAGTTYVFEYIYTESETTKKAYKVIKVASGS